MESHRGIIFTGENQRTWYRAVVEWYGKTKELEEKPVPLLFCLPQIPYGVTQA
jgi:hypothetical protein